jgi:pimeloyl-ACP methyl ester carboxylesterase
MSTARVAHTVSRGGARFSPNGLRAGCLAADDDGVQHLEGWELTAGGPVLRLRTEVACEASVAQVVALDDGRLLLSWHTPDQQLFTLFDTAGHGRALGTSTVPLRLVPAPARSGWLAAAVSVDDGGGSTLHRLNGTGDWLTTVARFPGRLGSAVVAGEQLVVTAVLDGLATPVAVDPDTGATTRLLDAGQAPAVHALAAGGGQILVAAETGDTRRLGLVAAAPGSSLHLLDVPGDLGGAVTPVAVDPAGAVLAIVVTAGARSKLALFDTTAGSAVFADVPAGQLVPVAAWPPQGLWLPCSAPTLPTDFGWLPAGQTRLRVRADTVPGLHAAQTVTLPGPAGPIEAVVYGDWRTSDRVVVALHGGPQSRWSLDYDPLLQTFAAAGLAVVAPNQRGSTGYGPAHAHAIHGAWGGPDLADVTALNEHLTAGRAPGAQRPALYGSSYGAFLALLAAAAEPDAWSACVAVAPFRSAASLYAQAGDPVRHLIDRMRAHTPLTDELGPRDLDRLAGRIRCPVLIVHGRRDETIPVDQSRHLVRHLIEHGHPAVTYREPDDRGHLAISGTAGDRVAEQVTDFLARHDACVSSTGSTAR